MLDELSSIFVCPNCHKGQLEDRGCRITCSECASVFPHNDGVPMLVRDPEEHEAEMQAARDVNPDWYLAEQLPENVSPWRHHLKKRRLYVEGVLRKYLRERQWEQAPRLLDLGCGDGNNLVWLADFGARVYGSDYNITRLARARHRMPRADVFLADILNYPIADETFDIIFFNHVLEHIEDDVSALKQVRRLLKPGGLFVLGTPNEGAWWWQLAYSRAPEVRATTDHVHFYTGRTLAQRVREAGLEVGSVHHLGWGPPDWRLDGLWRQHKWVDDWFERIGKIVIPRQASSLYIIAERPHE